MNKQLYAMVTTNCNLQCPHCEIRTRPDNYNRDKFINTINSFDGPVMLFGGEPTLYEDRLFDIIDNNSAKNIMTISTNLIFMNERLLKFYRTLNNCMATSWNPNRFTNEQYRTWLSNLNILDNNNLKCLVLITLTNDLFDMGAEKFIDICKEWNHNAIYSIKFEYYVGNNTEDYYQRADQFLCDVYKLNDTKLYISNIDIVRNGYCVDCSNIYTLSPNGMITHGCPLGYKADLPIECSSCERSEYCKPCHLHKHCPFPHNFEKLIKS